MVVLAAAPLEPELEPREPALHADNVIAPTARPTKATRAFLWSDTSLYLLVEGSHRCGRRLLGLCCQQAPGLRLPSVPSWEGYGRLASHQLRRDDFVDRLGSAGDALQQQTDDDLAHPRAGLVSYTHLRAH